MSSSSKTAESVDHPTDEHLHHVGFVVANIVSRAPGFVAALGSTWDGVVIHDPLQQVRVSFLRLDAAGNLLELVEPVGAQSPVRKFLESRQGGLHHLCFETASIDASLQRVRRAGGVIISRPKPAVAFDGRAIAWALTSDKLLVEYLSRAAA